MGASDEVEVELRDGILVATLVDEANRNALGAGLVGGLREALSTANSDPAVRALLITNRGRVFCAGANLKERSSARPGVSGRTGGAGAFEGLLQEIQASPTPVVARIDGHVVGGGNGLASACDLSIAREDVLFGFSEVRLGVAPAIISVVCLPKLRRGDALELFLRGHRFPATRAAEVGLISRAVPAEALDAEVEALLDDLRQGGPGALGAAKRLVYEVPGMESAAAFEWTGKLSNQLFEGDEAREGMAAFLAKRKPAWAEGGSGS